MQFGTRYLYTSEDLFDRNRKFIHLFYTILNMTLICVFFLGLHCKLVLPRYMSLLSELQDFSRCNPLNQQYTCSSVVFT